MDAVPLPLKRAIVAGVGLFIAFVGLCGAGIVAASQTTLVTLGNLRHPGTLLSLVSLILTAALMIRGCRRAMLAGMLGTAAGVSPAPASLRDCVRLDIPDLSPLFCQLDFQAPWPSA